jgi:hypothetical protein
MERSFTKQKSFKTNPYLRSENYKPMLQSSKSFQLEGETKLT